MKSTWRRQAGLPIALAIFGVTLLCGPQNLRAEDTQDAAGKSDKVRLQGGVVKVQTSLDELRDARLSVSRVRKSVANLYDEVTRQEMSTTTNPNFVGTTLITVTMPVYTGVMLPARPKWVHASMDEIGPIIRLFKEDVDLAVESHRSVEASETTKEALEPLRTEAFAAVDNSFKIYEQLESLTRGNSFDNDSIASASKSLDKQMKELDRSLKKGISILQKEAKAAKKRSTAGA